jgi:adenosine deaminase
MNGDDRTDADSEMHEFIRSLPKVELHAHLNGCIREHTLFELAKERGVTLSQHHFAKTPTVDDDHSMYNVRPRSLQDCFDMFAEIPKCVDDLPALARITTEALEDFAQHHVVYLELRSTPKKLLVLSGRSGVADKEEYCLTILNCMKDFEKREKDRYSSELAEGDTSTKLPMVCRFIVAVDRSQSKKDGFEHIHLAEALAKEYDDSVVGVDLGGNPTKVGSRVLALNSRQSTISSRKLCTESFQRLPGSL